MIIIGISGKKRSGKDTIANYVQTIYGKDKCIQVNFADALKDEVCHALKITREELENNKAHYRLILQGWGTDYRRELSGNDYWLKRWTNRVATLSTPKTQVVLCSDVRFVNEYDCVKQYKGIIWRVNRTPAPVTADDKHPSEIDLDQHKFDYIIENAGTIDELNTKVHTVLHSTIKKFNSQF